MRLHNFIVQSSRVVETSSTTVQTLVRREPEENRNVQWARPPYKRLA